MPYCDVPIDEARAHRTSEQPPRDLDDFWGETIAAARANARPTRFTPVDNRLTLINSFDVEFSGFDGQPVRAWFHIPATATVPLPVIVRFNGYGEGRGYPFESVLLANAGYAQLVMDNRGQGTWLRQSDTADPHDGEPAWRGLLTRGIRAPRSYYLRRLVTDAVRALDIAAEHPLADSTRMFAVGESLGGYLALVAASLHDGISGVAADVPAMGDIWQTLHSADKDSPFWEIAAYLAMRPAEVETVKETLGYFDSGHLVARATAPALFSLGLMDTVCPPSSIYSTFNAYGGPKEAIEYPFNGHEGGGALQLQRQLDWLQSQLD